MGPQFGKELNKKCVVFTSNKLYENEIPKWILEYTNEQGFQIDNSAIIILAEHLGSDLSKITNELNKIMLVVDKSEIITSKLLENIVLQYFLVFLDIRNLTIKRRA